MKKTRWFYLFILILAFCFVPFVNGKVFEKTPVLAASRQYDITEDNISEYDMDESLFRILKQFEIILGNEDYSDGVDFDLFSEKYKSVSPETQDCQYLIEDLNNGILDLTVGENSKFGRLKNVTKKIDDITGLNCMELTNIHTLILNDNIIKDISSDDLKSLPNLKILKAENNKLTKFELNPDLTMVNELYLSNNSLTEIDLRSLFVLSGSEPKADLSANNISSIEHIKFPTSGLSYLDLAFNNLTNLTANDLAVLNGNMVDGLKPDILLQGITDFENLLAGEKITVYQSTKIDDLKVVISYDTESDLYVTNGNNVICQTSAENDVETISMPAGRIVVEFKSGDTVINETNFPGLSKSILTHLATKKCQIKLPMPIFEATVDGEKVSDISKEQPNDVKVVFKVANSNNIPNIDDILYSEDKALFYSAIQTRNATYEAKDNQTITKNGEYTIKAYVFFDGISSDTVSLTVARRDIRGITIGIIIIVTTFVLGFSAYYITRWIKSGANVAPLSDKEVFKLNKKHEKKYGKTDEDLIFDLDKPRHDERVSDNVSDNGELVEDLNEVKKPFDTSVSDDFDKIEVDLGDMPSDIDNKRED